MNARSAIGISLATLMLSAPAIAAPGDRLSAELAGDGITGTVTMTEMETGLVHVDIAIQGVPEGAHGFHVHETGNCDPATGFSSAGGHFSAGMAHGVSSVGGPHPGDFPNVHAGSDGVVRVEYFTSGFALSGEPALLDGDGSAVVLHAEPDDYTSQPSGAAGSRIACGVIGPAN